MKTIHYPVELYSIIEQTGFPSDIYFPLDFNKILF